MTDLKWCQEHGTRGLDGSLCEVSVDKCEACRLRAALREIAQPTPSVDMADPETDQLRDALHKINLLRYMAERALSQGNAAASRPLSPSSSTPPAPDLPRGMLLLLRDGYGPGGGYYEPDQRLAAAVSLLECGWGSELDTFAKTQRPPDPAAPDLRGLLREARVYVEFFFDGHGPREEKVGPARRKVLARIDAALDDSGKVGEET